MGDITVYALYASIPVTPPDASYTIPAGAVIACISTHGEPYAPPPGMAIRAWASDTLWTPPASVPDQVLSWRGKVAMSAQASAVNAGKTVLDDANAAVAAAPIATQLAFNAPQWSRSSTTLNQLGIAIGLTSAQIDALFVAAANVSD